MLENFKLPDLGEGIREGEILEVKVSVGQQVKEGDPILVVETDKAAVEIPSPKTGRVEEVRIKPGEVVLVGEVMIVFNVEGEQAEGQDIAASPSQQPAPAVVQEQPARQRGKGPVPASPATRRLAREMGVELSDVPSTGSGGQVTAEDVRNFAGQPGKPVEEAGAAEQAREEFEAGKLPQTHPQLPDFSHWGSVQLVPLSPIRRAISRKMSLSWSQIPHVSLQELVDITELERIRKQNKAEVEERGGKLTLAVFALKASALALQAFPRLNSSLDPINSQLVLKKYYHLGIATDTERGLVVPVIRDVDRKSMLELAIALPTLTQKARQGKLVLEETTGGTFTLTNIGSIGGTGFQPIINYPEVAILGLGKARWQPVVLPDDNDNHEIVPRLMLPLVLSFDHRVLDGVEAARFVNELKETFENPSRILFVE